MANLLGLSAVHERLFQPAHDLLHVLMEGLLSAVIVDQVFKHVTRELIHARVKREGLIDDLALKNILEFHVHQSTPACVRPRGLRAALPEAVSDSVLRLTIISSPVA